MSCRSYVYYPLTIQMDMVSFCPQGHHCAHSRAVKNCCVSATNPCNSLPPFTCSSTATPICELQLLTWICMFASVLLVWQLMAKGWGRQQWDNRRCWGYIKTNYYKITRAVRGVKTVREVRKDVLVLDCFPFPDLVHGTEFLTNFIEFDILPCFQVNE